MFSKLAIPFLPNNPPRWPEVVDAVKNIIEVYATHARKHERVGEWIEARRLGAVLQPDGHPVYGQAHR